MIDDLLDEEVARSIFDAFPHVATMKLRRSIREHKYVAAQMDRYQPRLEAILYAFQEPEVVDAIARITGLADLLPDRRLYAGGISAMTCGQFLNPHIDNSHQESRERYRVLNLLYYTTPGWQPEWGGNLQLWDEGMAGPVRTVDNRFNRLVVMATSPGSWHAVERICHQGVRTCVSNYFFSPRPITNEGALVDHDYFHVTTFRGFPGQRARNAALVADGWARTAVRKVRPLGVAAPDHVYQRPVRT